MKRRVVKKDKRKQKKIIDNRELKSLFEISKKILPRIKINSILKVEDELDRLHALKKLILWELDRKVSDLEKEIEGKKNKGLDVLYAEIKLIKLKGKIKFFLANYDKEEFNKVKSLFKEIKKEIKLIS